MPPLRRPIALIIAVPLLAFATAAAAQGLFKWVDENGRVTYSDQPPPKQNAKSQESVRIVTPVNSNAASELARQDMAFKKRQEDAVKKAAEQDKKDKAEAAKMENCQRARGDLRAIRANTPVVRMTEGGERVPLDAAARDAEGKKLESFLEESCANPG